MPFFVKYGLNCTVALMEAKKASPVVIAYDVDSIGLVFLLALCRSVIVCHGTHVFREYDAMCYVIRLILVALRNVNAPLCASLSCLRTGLVWRVRHLDHVQLVFMYSACFGLLLLLQRTQEVHRYQGSS